MTIGGIQAFVSYVTFMIWPIQDLARVYAEMQHAIASAERIFSLIGHAAGRGRHARARCRLETLRARSSSTRRLLLRGRQAGADGFLR